MSTNQFLTDVLPLALAASISPTILAAGILILSSKNRPRAKTAVFVLGNLAVLAIAGAVALFLTHATTTSAAGQSSAPSPVDATIDVFVGVLLLFLTLRHVVHPKSPSDDTPPKWLAGLDRLSFGRSFLIGLGVMAVNFTTLILFFPAVRLIGEYANGLGNKLWLLALVMVIVELWILAVLGMTVVAPKRSASVLRRLNVWVGRHSRTICIVLFMAFGAYFLVKGIIGLV